MDPVKLSVERAFADGKLVRNRLKDSIFLKRPNGFLIARCDR